VVIHSRVQILDHFCTLLTIAEFWVLEDLLAFIMKFAMFWLQKNNLFCMLRVQKKSSSAPSGEGRSVHFFHWCRSSTLNKCVSMIDSRDYSGPP